MTITHPTSTDSTTAHATTLLDTTSRPSTPSAPSVLAARQTRLTVTPGEASAAIPLDSIGLQVVTAARLNVRSILNGNDDRLLVVAGPCALHDPAAALDYAHRLHELSELLSDDLLIVMRAYPERARLRRGWPGMIADPGLTGSGDTSAGLLLARATLRAIVGAGMPVGCEIVDPQVAPYLADLMSWGAIGARTVDSPVHRRLAASLAYIPFGMENRVDGAVNPAIDALVSAEHPHTHMTLDRDGRSLQVYTAGNFSCHLILRGGESGPNFRPGPVRTACRSLARLRRTPHVMVDAGHGNSGPEAGLQSRVLTAITDLVPRLDYPVMGVMCSSNLVGGSQLIPNNPAALVYGKSLIDACIGWEATERALTELAHAARMRHQARHAARHAALR